MRIQFIQHVSFEYPGSLIDWANERKHTVSFTKVFEHENYPALDTFDMLIVMGGPMGVYEENEFEWMKDQKKFLKEVIAAKKKVAGICLGSQFIAEALGAKVYKHTHNEIGWFDIYKKEDHLITKNLPANFTSFHWHGDTFSLPDGAVQLFHSEACEQQGFIYDDHVLALQFHPEINTSLLQSMVEHERHEVIKADLVQRGEKIIDLAKQYLPVQKEFVFTLMNEFISLKPL